MRCFNSRTPGGVRLGACSLCLPVAGFNSRTPGGVRLRSLRILCNVFLRFNSRTPGGVRPNLTIPKVGHWEVSIHAPREGCDLKILRRVRNSTSFNSRTPGGVRPSISCYYLLQRCSFNSRTPGGVRPRLSQVECAQPLPVSIHAPREGCD